MEEPTLLMAKPLLDGVPAPRGVCYVMLVPVITLEWAYNGALQQNHNTAELSGLVEAFPFFLPLGSVPREARVCIFFDSQQADICLVPNNQEASCDWPFPNVMSPSPCSISIAVVVTLGMSVQTTRLHSEHQDSSSHNIVDRRPPPPFDTTLRLGNNADLADIEPHLHDARHDRVPP